MTTLRWSNSILNAMYVNNSSTNFYIGLSSTLPSSDGTGVSEPGGNGYARVKINGFSNANDGVITNIANITFPVSTGEWFSSDKRAAYYVIFDGNTRDSNVLAAGNLAAEMEIGENVTIVIAAGVLSISLV